MIPNGDQQPTILALKQNWDLMISSDGGYTWSEENGYLNFEYCDQLCHLGQMGYDQWRDEVWISTGLGLMHSPIGELTSIDESSASLIPEEYEILTAYPNPFNGTTQITYRLKNRSNIKLKLYNIEGREVMDLFDGNKSAGEHTISLNSTTLATGIYFLKLNSGSETYVKKLTLLK